MVARVLQEISVNRDALVVGTGEWATKVSRRLKEIYGMNIQQISARSLLDDKLKIERDTKFHLLVCATRPELQQQVIFNYSNLSKFIWLEKPIAGSYQGAKDMLAILENGREASALVNFSWIFSEVWKTFALLNLCPAQVTQIQVSRSAPSENHTYMSSIEDYGSHDIALLYSWIGTRAEKSIEVEDKKLDFHSFKAFLNGIPIIWSIDIGVKANSMVWTIFWKDEKSTRLDFYKNRIIHDGRIIDVKGPDSIENFLRALYESNSNFQRFNHLLALRTKEFFSI